MSRPGDEPYYPPYPYAGGAHPPGQPYDKPGAAYPPGYPPPGYPPPPPLGYHEPLYPVPGGRRASMGARFGGLVLDTLLVLAPTIAIGAIAGGFHRTQSTTCSAVGDCIRRTSYTSDWIFDVVGAIVSLLYFSLLVGLQGRTVGHRATGLRVVDVHTGTGIGVPRAFLRWLVLGVTGAICTLGYWSPFFDSERRQGWHDKAARAVVIPAR